MMKLVIDTMSGDFSPENEILGTLAYLNECPNHHAILIGDKIEILDFLEKSKSVEKNISIVQCNESILMHDSPSKVLKSKTNSSMTIGHQILKEEMNAIFLSSGNTGAQLAIASHIIGRLDGINRPSIGAFLPNSRGFTFLIDVGSNINSKVIHFQQNAIMSDILSRYIYNKEKPSIGLLNIGKEPTKGTEVYRNAYELIEESNLNFIGNVEGNNLLDGHYDVVLCDGFTGNVVLKLYESISPFILNSLKEKKLKGKTNQISFEKLKTQINQIIEEYDYQNYGGVPILGINGISMISHGRSSALAIKNTLRHAVQMYEKKINLQIQNEIRKI